MSRPKAVTFAAGVLAILVVLAAPSVLKGALYVGKHEADMLHILQITFRMQSGQWPHIDFMTPIGVLAFLPIVGFIVQDGSAIGCDSARFGASR